MVQKSLKKNAILNFLRSFMNIAFPIISFPYASRILLPDGIGKVNFANSVIEYFVLIAGLGVGMYAAREASKIRDNASALNKLTREILAINIVSTLLAYILFAIALFALPKFSDYRILLIVCATKVLFSSISMEWLYQAEEEYGYITLRSAFFQLVSLVMLFVCVKTHDDYIWYALIGVVSNVGANICNLLYARRFVNVFERTSLEIKKHLRPIFTFFGVACASKIHSAMDTVMLGFMADDMAVGYYSAASKIRRLVVELITYVLGTLMPRSSYYIETKQFDEYNNILKKAAGIVFFFSVPATAGLIVLAQPIIVLFSGSEYLSAIPIMRVMAPIVIVYSVTSFLNHVVLTPYRKERYVLYAQVIGCVLNIGLNIPLITLWGAFGAGLSTLFVESAITLFLVISAIPNIKDALAHLGIFLLKTVIGSVIMFLAVHFVISLSSIAFVQLLCGVLSGVLVYAIVELLLKNETAWWLWHIIVKMIKKGLSV